MAVVELNPYDVYFPPVDWANSDGLLAIGGALRADWLLAAYEQGIFPWYSEGDPILWWSPDPRFVLYPHQVKTARSMKPMLRDTSYTFALDRAFETVIDQCASTPRHGQNGTWITNHMKSAYIDLHRIGMAHSAETYKDGVLVGGLYGVSIGAAFFGESMYSEHPNASKYALIHLCNWLSARGFHLIDCQVYTAHLERMGAEFIRRKDFAAQLQTAMKQPTLRGPWDAGSFSQVF